MNLDKILQDFDLLGYSYLELPKTLFLDLIELPKIYYSFSIQERYENIVNENDGILGYTPSESELESYPIQNFLGNKKRGYSSYDFLSDNSKIIGSNRLFKRNNWTNSEFRELANHLYSSLQNISAKLSEQILSKFDFSTTAIFNTNETLSLMRLLLYKSTSTENISKAHTDYEFVTFVISENQGLEIRNSNKEWEPVKIKPFSAILLVGDMLEAVSKGKYKSTLHRVKTNSFDRTSTIFFQGLPLDFKVKYSTESIKLDKTFGEHILPLLLSGAVHLQNEKEVIARELNIETTYSNPFKTDK